MSKAKGSRFIIYALHHPISLRMYVGKSTSGMERPQQHFRESSLRRYKHLPRSKWIQSIRKRGFEPETVVLEVCSNVEDLDEAERFYIAYLRSVGVPLLNLTDGGDGVVGHKHDEQSRAKMSAVQKARAERNPDRLVQISRQYWSSDEAREKQRQRRLGTKRSKETCEKIAAALKGKPKSEKAREHMRGAAEDRWKTPGYREKQIEVQKESHSSEESRQRASEIAATAWQDEKYRDAQKDGWRRRKERAQSDSSRSDLEFDLDSRSEFESDSTQSDSDRKGDPS